jgi:DNA-binding NarL/FixJ family response regulator
VKPTVTIVLADDHQVVRQGLKALLQAERDFSVIGEAADGLQAIEAVERLAPDVLVLDLMMPGLGGLDVARRVSRHDPKTRIVVLSMHASEAYVLEALRCGASAYVVKDASAANLVDAVREVTAGRRYLSPPLTEKAIEAYVKRTKSGRVDAYEGLTTREREVLHLAAEGLSGAAIGKRLGISLRTAETHRANAMRKLGLHSRVELVRYAVARGLISLAPEVRPPDRASRSSQ